MAAQPHHLPLEQQAQIGDGREELRAGGGGAGAGDAPAHREHEERVKADVD